MTIKNIKFNFAFFDYRHLFLLIFNTLIIHDNLLNMMLKFKFKTKKYQKF